MSYNISAWISDNMHREKRICQRAPSIHISLTMVHVTLLTPSAQINGTHNSSLCMAFIEYLMQTGKFPHVVDYKSPILCLLMGSPFWKEMMFNCAAGGISRLHMPCFSH